VLDRLTGCAQRATLLQAPDHPHYELLAGFSLEDNEKLPPRFHIPVFDDCGVPNSWLCAVCQEEGVVTGWPCATAQKYGTQVFTPLHKAETAQEKQDAELASYRALELGDPDGRVSASCGNPGHPTWLRKPDDMRGCPWCGIAEAVQRLQFTQSTEPDHVKAASLFEIEMGLRHAAGTQNEVTA